MTPVDPLPDPVLLAVTGAAQGHRVAVVLLPPPGTRPRPLAETQVSNIHRAGMTDHAGLRREPFQEVRGFGDALKPERQLRLVDA